MVKKKSSTRRRRKKSNDTTTNEGAKRSKTEDEEKNLSTQQYRDGILQGIRAVLGKMDEKDLLAVMVYVGSMEGGAGEKEKTTTSAQQQEGFSVTATSREESIAITSVTVNPSSSPTPTTERAPANPTTSATTTTTTTATTTVPPSPQDEVIELTKKTRPTPDNLVRIDPLCFNCDGRTALAATKCKNQSINAIVNSIVENTLTPEQRAFALKQAMVHPHVRGLAKSAGLIDD